MLRIRSRATCRGASNLLDPLRVQTRKYSALLCSLRGGPFLRYFTTPVRPFNFRVDPSAFKNSIVTQQPRSIACVAFSENGAAVVMYGVFIFDYPRF